MKMFEVYYGELYRNQNDELCRVCGIARNPEKENSDIVLYSVVNNNGSTSDVFFCKRSVFESGKKFVPVNKYKINIDFAKSAETDDKVCIDAEEDKYCLTLVPECEDKE